MDFCGPENNRFLSALVPDRIRGVDLSPFCEQHDIGYTEGGTEADRLRHDKELRSGVKNALKASLESFLLAHYVSSLYYYFCRFLGKSNFNYT